MTAVCPNCGIIIRNLGRHLSRGRCDVQHIRAQDRQSMKKVKQMKED